MGGGGEGTGGGGEGRGGGSEGTGGGSDGGRGGYTKPVSKIFTVGLRGYQLFASGVIVPLTMTCEPSGLQSTPPGDP